MGIHYFQLESFGVVLGGWPKKASHVIPNDHKIVFKIPVNDVVFFLIKFECERSTRILSLGIKYSTHDLICDVINCASRFDVGNAAT